MSGKAPLLHPKETMKFVAKSSLILCTALAFGACGDDDPPPIPSTDTAIDTTTDVGVDATPDTVPDVAPDVEPDVDPDVEPDTEIDADAADPCADLDLCPEAGTTCDGNDLVACEENDDGCLVETVTECGDTAICDDSGAEALCIEDVCTGLDLCDEEGLSCDGGELVDCTANEDGCIVRTTTACEDGTECSDEGEVAECVATCTDDPACAEGAEGSCDGTTLGICEMGESGCLELATTDCAELVEGGTCDGVELLCLTPGDPCEGVDPADLCDPGDLGAGSCDADIFSLCTTNIFGCAVLERTDCAEAEGGFCTIDGCDVVEAGACDDIDPADLCEEEGALTCDEANVIECQRADAGCLVLVDTGACEGGDVCEEGFCVDPCADVEVCEVELSCDGADLVTCEVVEGCLVESARELCEAGCDDSGETPECTPFDPCVDLACELGDLPFCDLDEFFTCVSDEELGCDRYVPENCREEDPTFTCVDDGFVIACSVDPCGDGVFDGFVGEECDDGNGDDGDGCSSICALEDGFICDTVEGTSVCEPVICGDEIVDGDEQCDDGNTDDEDGCSSTCTVEEGYECTGEPSVCLVPECGDGVRNGTESCDDGNTTDEDGCSSECWIEVSGEAGAIATITAALDGSEAQYARQSSDCTGDDTADHYFDAFTVVNIGPDPIEISLLSAWRGDGYIHVFTPDFDPADPRATCVVGDDDFGGTSASFIESVVLDGDSTYVIVASTFAPALTIGEYSLTLTTVGCGDGAVGEIEDCDDGNTDGGDGCSPMCAVEPGFDCDDEPSYCFEVGVCGGGSVDEGEDCDDGNTDDGDGCSPMCAVEPGFICSGEFPSVCVPAVCGDGIITPGESCDDGNTTDGDGCSATCAAELAADATFDLEGSIDASDPTFNRANSSCSAIGSVVHHDVFPLVNPTGDALEVTVTADWSGDGYLHAYSGFDPSDALLECVAGSDDFGGILGSQVIFTMDPASSAEIVASTFFALTATGAYTLEVDPVIPAP